MKGLLGTSKSDWWCSGFYPGALFYLYEATKDAELLKEGERMLAHLKKEQFNKTTHDLGFMMFCSFGSLPHSSEIDVALTYADYYFIGAMLRYKNII